MATDELGYKCMNCKDCHEWRTCQRVLEQQKHSSEVADLLRHSSDVVTLVIGTDKEKRFCHRALLGFYSEVLRKECYGESTNPEETEMQVNVNSNDAVVAFKAFLVWAYSGLVVENDTREGLIYQWILGEKLQCPRYTNEVMHAIINSLYEGGKQLFLSPSEAKLIYDKTEKISKLRAFASWHIRTSRSARADERGNALGDLSWSYWATTWVEILDVGGELAEDFVAGSGHLAGNRFDGEGIPEHHMGPVAPDCFGETAEMPIEVFLAKFLTPATS